MDFKEAYDKLKKQKREALTNSCNIKVSRRELNKALEALEDKIGIRVEIKDWFYCVKVVYKYIDYCVISVYNIKAGRNTNETKRFD